MARLFFWRDGGLFGSGQIYVSLGGVFEMFDECIGAVKDEKTKAVLKAMRSQVVNARDRSGI